MIDFTSKKELEAEETLTRSRLKKLECLVPASLSKRPDSNFVELMNWVESNFSSFLKDRKNVNKLVNNTIVINGQFLKFAEDNNITITPLYKDSIISWKSDSGSEKFFAQGVFLIEADKCQFIHSALFHKGMQNDDEVSFFVLISEKNYENYLSLRNQFETWYTGRDRENNLVRVIGGDDFPYGYSSWDDVFLEESKKKELKSFVENFLSSEDFYRKHNIPWKAGALFLGPPGCGKSTLIKTIISNYNFKPVTITPTVDDSGLREAFSYAEDQSPSLLYFEDLDSLLERNVDLSSFLNLMDGIASKNGILVVATANDYRKLKPSIMDRPSRFDRKFEISLPNQKIAYIYLCKWFGKMISSAKLKQISKLAEENQFSFAYLKELYISSMFEALSKKRKTPTEKDVDNSLSRLMKDKNINKKSLRTRSYLG